MVKMKNFIYIFFIVYSINLSAQDIQEEATPKATQLEMFLFKIGFTSLLNDFETEKNITKLNKKDIEKLKADVHYILNKMNQNKLKETSNNKNKVVVQNNNKLLEEINLLKNELAKLKLDIKKKNIKTKIVKKTNKQFVVKVSKAYIRKAPSGDSKIIKEVYFNAPISIIFCDKYGWCKMENQEAYIPRFVLKSL
jgi:tetrahydrodipicolinate N-succinyltransferase